MDATQTDFHAVDTAAPSNVVQEELLSVSIITILTPDEVSDTAPLTEPSQAPPTPEESDGIHTEDATPTLMTEGYASDAPLVVQDEETAATPSKTDATPFISIPAAAADNADVEEEVPAVVAHPPPLPPPTPVAVAAFPNQIFPGIGKILALPSQKACDVDAFVEHRIDDNDEEVTADDYGVDDDDDDYDESSYPIFPSTLTETTVLSDDLETGGLSPMSASSMQRNDYPLDSHTDPFAPRVGKTLLWRNINMTLVRRTQKFKCNH